MSTTTTKAAAIETATKHQTAGDLAARINSELRPMIDALALLTDATRCLRLLSDNADDNTKNDMESACMNWQAPLLWDEHGETIADLSRLVSTKLGELLNGGQP